MTADWRAPDRIDAHRLLRSELPPIVARGVAPLEAPRSVTVERVFEAGLLRDVVLGPPSETNTRIDTFIDDFVSRSLLQRPVDLEEWADFSAAANLRRPMSEAFLGQSLEAGREFLRSEPGMFLVRSLPFENRQGQNDTHEIIYFRDSGVHRRLIARSLTLKESSLSPRAYANHVNRLERFVPKRWEAFVVTTILDLVRDRCVAYAYRHEETREIDLVLEWSDRSPREKWAIEVASAKFNTHPADYFADECAHLGVRPEHRFVVRWAEACDGQARGRGGVPAVSLPIMIDRLRNRMLR